MSEWPITIELTPNGKTLLIVYPSLVQGKLVARALQMLGEPEMICPSEQDPDNIMILFPHQDMSAELKELAERMSSANLLQWLGFDRDCDSEDNGKPEDLSVSESSLNVMPDIEEYEVVGNWLAPEICEGDLVTVEKGLTPQDRDIVFIPWRERQCIVSRYRVNIDGQPYLEDRYGNYRIPADADFSVVTERRRVLQ